MSKPITSDEARIAIVSNLFANPVLAEAVLLRPFVLSNTNQRTIFLHVSMHASVNAPFGAHFECAAYVLDLRAKFPPASESPSSVNLWRERVLGLEQDVAYLQNQFNHERISKWMALPIDFLYSAAEQKRYLYKPAKRLRLLSCPPSCLRPQQRRIPKENHIRMPYREPTCRPILDGFNRKSIYQSVELLGIFRVKHS